MLSLRFTQIQPHPLLRLWPAMTITGQENLNGASRSQGHPRQSSRLAAKVERNHRDAKHDSSEPETSSAQERKPKRKATAQEGAPPKRKHALSPKFKENKSSDSGSSEGGEFCVEAFKSDHHQSDKYCHFCQVPFFSSQALLLLACKQQRIRSKGVTCACVWFPP